MRERLTATMERVRRDSVTYLHLDYRDVPQEALIAAIEENTNQITALAHEGPFLRLVDLRDHVATGELMATLKEHSKLLKPHDRAVAVLGVTTARRLLLDMVNRFANTNKRAFDFEAEAVEWLVRLAADRLERREA